MFQCRIYIEYLPVLKIKNSLKSEELESWLENLIKELSFTVVNDKHIEKDLVLTAG